MKRLFAGLLCASFLGCAAKPKPPPPTPGISMFGQPAPSSQAKPSPTPKPKLPRQPFMITVMMWLSAPARLLPHKEVPPQGQPVRLVGIVKMVDKNEDYVLIDAQGIQGINPGDLLITITNQRQTSNLRMGSLKDPPFVIADIASGSPEVGDRVFKP